MIKIPPLLLSFISCAQIQNRPIETPQQNDIFSFNLPQPTKSQLGDKQTLWATYYYLPQVSSVEEDGYALLDIDGNELGPILSHKDWCSSAMEGSVLVEDPEEGPITYNYAGTSSKGGTVDCTPFYKHNVSKTKFRKANGPYGDGVKDYRLIPLRTIAVDKTHYSYGSIIYVPEARGTKITLPNDKEVTHDGYFFAGDTGGAIKTNHIDVYIGMLPKNPFPWVKSNSEKTFEAYVVDNPELQQQLEKLHLELE